MTVIIRHQQNPKKIRKDSKASAVGCMGNISPAAMGNIATYRLPVRAGPAVRARQFGLSNHGTPLADNSDMADLLLCSNNKLLSKSLYGILRDDGYSVETADHPAMAVRMAIDKDYAVLIIDSEPFGLSVDDAIRIIRNVRPAITVLFIGEDSGTDALTIEAPVDLSEFRSMIQSMQGSPAAGQSTH